MVTSEETRAATCYRRVTITLRAQDPARRGSNHQPMARITLVEPVPSTTMSMSEGMTGGNDIQTSTARPMDPIDHAAK